MIGIESIVARLDRGRGDAHGDASQGSRLAGTCGAGVHRWQGGRGSARVVRRAGRLLLAALLGAGPPGTRRGARAGRAAATRAGSGRLHAGVRCARRHRPRCARRGLRAGRHALRAIAPDGRRCGPAALPGGAALPPPRGSAQRSGPRARAAGPARRGRGTLPARPGGGPREPRSPRRPRGRALRTGRLRRRGLALRDLPEAPAERATARRRRPSGR